MPGEVVKVAVKEGDSVKSGQLIMVLEAMKMLVRIINRCLFLVKGVTNLYRQKFAPRRTVWSRRSTSRPVSSCPRKASRSRSLINLSCAFINISVTYFFRPMSRIMRKEEHAASKEVEVLEHVLYSYDQYGISVESMSSSVASQGFDIEPGGNCGIGDPFERAIVAQSCPLGSNTKFA